MTDFTRTELESRCQQLLLEGQQVTSRIEGLLQQPGGLESDRFDRELAGLRQQQEKIHQQLEQAMERLSQLDG
jgi:hypothetical protein